MASFLHTSLRNIKADLIGQTILRREEDHMELKNAERHFEDRMAAEGGGNTFLLIPTQHSLLMMAYGAISQLWHALRAWLCSSCLWSCFIYLRSIKRREAKE